MNGKVWVFGDDINTDVIFPGRYTYEPMEDEAMGKYAMEDADSDFHKKGVAGDILVAGKNFGCGSSREQAVKCLKARGVAAVIAGGFARIFYRNAINEGLLVITCPEAINLVKEGEMLTVDMKSHKITTEHGEAKFAPYPLYLTQLVDSGGLIPYTKQRLSK